jgi:peptidoglycan L-alanyl-D-glutamate endopeptidase CwlK
MNQDKITLQRIGTLHTAIRSEVRQLYLNICGCLNDKVMCRFAYTFRSIEEQNEIYAQGRTKPGNIVTNAKGGRSYHNYGLAFDIVMLLDKDGNGTFETASWNTSLDFDKDGKADWQEVVELCKQYGWEWGDTFRDYPHFQKTFGHTWKELSLMKKDKDGYVIL